MRNVMTCGLWLFLLLIVSGSCRNGSDPVRPKFTKSSPAVEYAAGFSLREYPQGMTRLEVYKPWPGSAQSFVYWLIPRDMEPADSLLQADAVVKVPVHSYVATSTTHIAALEALEELDKLKGFPGLDYISSEKARSLIRDGAVTELGANEALNTEMTLALHPEVIFGFSIDAQNAGYNTLISAGIPVVYNGDWTEQSPLGKAEWIRFFAPFFGKQNKADSLFNSIETAYHNAAALAAKATKQPAVLSGALYKDVWYAPGGKSWAAQFIRDANGKYLWSETEQTGSLALGIEAVLAEGLNADIWIAPSQFISRKEMEIASPHYARFKAMNSGEVYTYATKKGETGGLIYFEIAPQRPDLVLKDLIHIFHPGTLPDYEPHFFSPLE